MRPSDSRTRECPGGRERILHELDLAERCGMMRSLWATTVSCLLLSGPRTMEADDVEKTRAETEALVRADLAARLKVGADELRVDEAKSRTWADKQPRLRRAEGARGAHPGARLRVHTLLLGQEGHVPHGPAREGRSVRQTGQAARPHQLEARSSDGGGGRRPPRRERLPEDVCQLFGNLIRQPSLTVAALGRRRRAAVSVGVGIPSFLAAVATCS